MSELSKDYLQETSMLDFMHPHIQSLVEKKKNGKKTVSIRRYWRNLQLCTR